MCQEELDIAAARIFRPALCLGSLELCEGVERLSVALHVENEEKVLIA